MSTNQILMVILLILGGCTTTSKDIVPPAEDLLPPNYSVSTDKDLESVDLYLQNLIQPDSHVSTRWWVLYKRGQIWAIKKPSLSCKLFTELSQENLFVLNQLARLRAAETCTNTQMESLLASPNYSANPWLKKLSLEVELKLSNQLKDKKRMMMALWEKSKQNLPREEKVEYTRQALKLAKKIKDKNSQKKLNARVYRLAPRLKPNPAYKDYFKVAYDYRRVRNFEKARQYYRKIINHKKSMGDQIVKAYKGIARTYKIQNKKPQHLKTLADMSRYSTSLLKRARNKIWAARLYRSTQLTYARALWTASQIKKAKSVLSQTEKQARKYGHLQEVYWIRGRMMEEKHKYAAAIWWFEKALNQKGVSDDFKRKLKWYMAWNHRKLKQYESSLTLLNDLKSSEADKFESAKYHFWLAKVYSESENPILAEEEFKELIKEDPLGYYGLMAHREIKKEYTAPPLEGKKSIRLPGDLEPHIKKSYIDWLISVKETEVAKEYLDEAAENYKKEGGDRDKSWVTLFRYYARAGEYISMFAQLGQLPANQRQRLLSQNPDLIFPKPYFEHVAESAHRFGVSVEFIYSIMRQESAFNPKARSPMDAFGLMQMLPRVAKRTAQDVAIQLKKPEDLYQPHVSVTLGSAHLRELWDKYNGEFIPAVASYNADSRAIRNWIKTRYKGDSIEFIEDIPYEETKAYVKLVLRNLIFYKTLSYPDQPIPFPEWTLKISSTK